MLFIVFPCTVLVGSALQETNDLLQYPFSTVLCLHVNCGNFSWSYVFHFSPLFSVLILMANCIVLLVLTGKYFRQHIWKARVCILHPYVNPSCCDFLINVSKFLFVISFVFHSFLRIILLIPHSLMLAISHYTINSREQFCWEGDSQATDTYLRFTVHCTTKPCVFIALNEKISVFDCNIPNCSNLQILPFSFFMLLCSSEL